MGSATKLAISPIYTSKIKHSNGRPKQRRPYSILGIAAADCINEADRCHEYLE